MENIPGNLGRKIKALSFENRPINKPRQWTILWVDDHGEVISFTRFKEAVIIFASMLFIAIIAAAIFSLLYNSALSDNKKLQTILNDSQEKARALRNENDILMARLVIPESKVNANSTKKYKIYPKKSSTAIASNASEPKQDKILNKQQAPKNPIVYANNFKVYYDNNKNIIVQYIIKKNSLKTKIAGRTVAILKNSKGTQDEWLILPPDNLINGKPLGRVGQEFVIANYRKIKFRATQIYNPNRFNKATIFVFSAKGELILEKDFPIIIKNI